MWTTGLGENKTLHKENTVLLFENKVLTDGEHILRLIYREPMAFIETIITEKNNVYPVINIPIVNILLNPSTVYGRQTQTTTYKPLEQTYPTTFPPELMMFPPKTMSPTVRNLGDGIYSIKMSSGNWSWPSAYKIFDGNKLYGSNGSGINVPSSFYKDTDQGYYTGTTTTTDAAGKSYKGEWIDVYFPIQLYLSFFYIYRLWTAGQPYDVVVLGSNNQTTWTTLAEQKSLDYEKIESNPDMYRAFVNVSSKNPYSSYRMVIQRVGVVWSNGVYYGGKNFNLSEMEFYGTV
jgi:hypothetical protein